MFTLEDQAFRDQHVDISGAVAYSNCTFINCTVWGEAGAMSLVTGCTFIKCDIDGPMAQDIIAEVKRLASRNPPAT